MPIEGMFIEAAQSLEAQSTSFFDLAQKKLEILGDVKLMDDAHKRHKAKYSSLILKRLSKISLRNKLVMVPIFGAALAISAFAPSLYNVLRPVFLFVGADIGRKAFQHGVDAVKGEKKAEKAADEQTADEHEQTAARVVQAPEVAKPEAAKEVVDKAQTKPAHVLEKEAVREALAQMSNADLAVATELGTALVGSTRHLSLLVQAGTMAVGAGLMTGTVLFLTSAPLKMEHYGRSLQQWNPEGFWSGMAARTTMPRRFGTVLRASAPAVTRVMSWKWGKPIAGMIASGRVITESTIEPKFKHGFPGETILFWECVGFGVGLGMTVAEKFVYKPYLQQPLQNKVYKPLHDKVYNPVKTAIKDQWKKVSHTVVVTHMLQKHVGHAEPPSPQKPESHFASHLPHHVPSSSHADDPSKTGTYFLVAHHPAGGTHPHLLMAATRS